MSNQLLSTPADPIPHETEVTFCSRGNVSEVHFFAFNTHVVLELHCPVSEDYARAFLDKAVALCRTWERLLSRTLPHSDISRINGAQGQPVEVAPETFALLEKSLVYCAASQGTFDITIGPAVALWNFAEGKAPTALQREAVLPLIGWQQVRLGKSPEGLPLVQLQNAGAAIDLGGMAKGWMADALTEAWDPSISQGFLANLGGNVAVRGRRAEGGPWRVGLRNPADPRNPEALLGAVPLEEGSVVTSGTYERAFASPAGQVLHHILDPRTALPVETDVAGVTVVANRSIDAEGYSTTLLALGREKGAALARQVPEILQAFFVSAEGKVVSALP